MSTSDNTPNTLTIQLTKNAFCTIDETDSDLASFKWQIQKDGYARRGSLARDGFFGKSIYMSRVILSRMLGRSLEKGEFCDHIDGNRTNNSRCNLRVANRAQNKANSLKPKTGKNPYKGVCLRKNGRWQAQIKVNQKKINLGMFDSPEKAHEAYCEAAKLYFGEFAKCE